MNFTDMLLNPVYLAFGVIAEISPIDGPSAMVTVIDKTSGVEVSDEASVDVGTVRPVAAVRASELIEKSIALDDLDDGLIAFNGKEWRIKSHILRPSPHGEGDGQVYLLLMEDNHT